jgi:hypothetical protein
MRDLISVPQNNTVYVLPKVIQQGTAKQQSHYTLGINFFLLMFVACKSDYAEVPVSVMYFPL